MSDNPASPPVPEMDAVKLDEIADYLGLTIETVSRTLTKFKQEGKISLPSRDEITIKDPSWLTTTATGEDTASAFI